MLEKIKTLWSSSVDRTTQRVANSKASRELLRVLVYSLLLITVYCIYQTIDLIRSGSINMASGSLMGGIFTLLGAGLSVTIPAFVSALNTPDNLPKPPAPPTQGEPG